MNADTLWSLFWHFLVISLVAFRRGSGALPLIGRVSVAQMGAASGVERLSERRWLRDFGDGTAPAVVGLFTATGWTLARTFMTAPLMATVTMTAFVLAVRTKVAPGWLLAAGFIVGAAAERWY